MTENEKIRKLLHDIKSKSSNIRSAADLIKDASSEERKEILTLMKKAAQELLGTVAELEKHETEKPQ